MQPTGHKSICLVRGYIREANLFGSYIADSLAGLSHRGKFDGAYARSAPGPSN
jgi:hypothetical protein